MSDLSNGLKNRYVISVLIALTALALITGVGYAFTTPYVLQIGGGDGFLSDVDPSAGEDAPLRVIDLQVGKTDVASETEIEVEAMVANYGNEVKQDVVIKPVLTSEDGTTDVSDDMTLRPKDSYTVEEFQPGSIRTFRFYIEFGHDPIESGEQQLTYKLKLTDEDGNSDINDIKQSERFITILPEGTSTAGSRFIDREPFSISTFPVDKYKDRFVNQRDVIGADRSIPPVNKDSNGDISDVDVAKGEVTSYGALTQTDTRNSGTISAVNGEMRIGFGFESIPDRNHYALRLAHEDDNIEEDIELTLVDRRGNEIDKNSTYMVAPSSGEIKQFDYHLTSKEVDHIRSQGDVYVVSEIEGGGSTNDADVKDVYYLSLLGVNEVVDLPSSDLNVTSLELVDPNHREVNGRPTYDLDQKIQVQAEVKNEGSGSYSGNLGLNELNQGFTSARSINTSTIINPNQTRTYTFETTATRPGTHSYVIDDESLCSSDIECPLQLQVRESADDIVPRIRTNSPNIIAEETARFELTGVFSDDYGSINSITWSFGESERAFSDAGNGVTVDYVFSEQGRKTVTAEVEYNANGDTRTAEHSIFVDVIERPTPEINAVYYDIKTADRSGTRSGEPYGPGLGGQIVSDSCEDQCGGEMSIAGISPQMTDGLSMMIVDKNFPSNQDSEIVHYGTYDFQENQYASNDGSEFSGELEQELSPGAIPSFRDHIDQHAGEGKIFIFVGGGDPSIPIDVESELEQMGAKFGGYGAPGENFSYTFITESQSPNQYKPVHESILPPSTGDSLTHNIQIKPVEASSSDVPTDQEVYLNVRDSKGSDYYQSLDDDQISYSWSGVDSRGEYAYIVPSSTISASVDLNNMPISGADQQDSATVPVDDKEANIQARAMKNVIEEGGKATFTAAYSYDSDNRIDPSKLDWSVNSPSGTTVTQSNVQSKQSISVVGGEVPGVIEATLLYEGQEMDTAEVQLITDAEARFDYNRVPGTIDYNRGTVSPSESVIYNYGQTDNANSLSELDLSTLTADVTSTFGNGFVIDNGNNIQLQADASSGTSASRFVRTNSLDLGQYQSIYVAYERSVSSELSNPTGEVGYVSVHTGEITSDKFTYGEKATLRGTDTDIAMTSDVVTNEQFNRRYGIMELDVSGVSGESPVTVHARANVENNGLTSVNIYEMWAGGSDSIPQVEQLFDSNIYPDELSGDVQYISSRKGLGFKSLGNSDGGLRSRSFQSDFLESEYNFPDEGSNSFRVETGGIDITSGLNNDFVRTDSAGSSALITGDSSDQPLLIDQVVTEVESSNTENPLVMLDARNSAALPEDDFSWSASNPSVVDIKNPNAIRTVAEFTQTGQHDITLSVDSDFGSSSKTKTIQVDSVGPDVSLEMPGNAEVGDSVPINVGRTGGSSVEETVVLYGNGEKSTFSGAASTSYTYTNPGTYDVTVISRNSNGVTSADSKEITIGTLGVEVVDSISEQVFIPNDAYFDATGDAGSVPEESQPAQLIDLSNFIQNEDEMTFTWEAPDGSTFQGSTYQHPVDSEGTDNINLIVEGPSGQTDTLEIELQKNLATPTIESLSATPNPIKSFEPFNVQYSVEQPSGVNAQVEVDLNDGTGNITGAITGSSNSELPADISTINRNPGDLPDTYTVELYVENEFSESAYRTTELEVESGPKAEFQFLDSEPFTVGRSVSMDASGSAEPYGDDLTYEWTFYDGNNPVTYSRTGDSSIQYAFEYVDDATRVQLTVIDSNGDTDTVERTVSVESDASAGLTASSVQRTGNSHEFEFDASSSSAGGVNNDIETYRFDFDNDGSYEQTSPNPVVSYAYEESGDFTATVQVEDSFGSTASATTTITSEPGVFTEPVRLTTCGNEQGRVGPTQSECDSEYAGTELEDSVNVYDNGIQELDLPVGGYYRIETVGAGYNSNGKGAVMEGIVELSSDTTLQVAVGQQGGNNGGAGGTFVATGSSYTSASELIVAGGGSLGSSSNPIDANTGQGGNPGRDGAGGGSNGNGGGGADGTGGGGFYSDGGGGQATNQGGYAFQNGAEGTGANVRNAFGGFGGGGAPEDNGDEPGGGGGYSGGGGADDGGGESGGGGGSYISNSFSNTATSVSNSGAGYVELQFLGQNLPASCEEIQDSGIQDSGNYLIQPEGQAVEVYCEMNPDTTAGNAGSSGGPVADEYSFKYVQNGQTTRRVSDSNTCKANDMSLFQPRGPDEYDVGRNYIIDDVGYAASNWDHNPDMTSGGPGGGIGPLGVHISVNGESASNPNGNVNFDSEEDRIMKSEHYGSDFKTLGEDNLYGEGSNGWKTTISERFWVAGTAVDDTEPNGDYDANTWLGWQNYNNDGYVTNYNDLRSANYGYDTYLCWLAP